jgi:phenylalanyl-tRNA synthetase alpha chain
MKLKNLESTKQDLLEKLQSIQSDTDLETFRLEYLSRQGLIAQLFEQLKTLDAQEKREVGPNLNSLKQEIQASFDLKKEELFAKTIELANQKKQNFDVTLSKLHPKGSLHPYTHLTNQIEDIFISMGFQIADGPELETEFFNFTGLNIPANHPAREDSDTFWIDDKHLIRTQTSTVQIKMMQNMKPPMALIVPGRVMRNEATDASHDFMFMQLEGMLIAENISVANLLATLQTFLTKLFEKDVKLRVRPGYFPFVEPGLEIDASCPFCQEGCSTCKKTGWIELLGAGIIHPEVLKHGGIDHTKYSGFAFGCGLTRLAMLKYGIPDIRLLHSSNLKFLQQFA